MFHHNIRRNRLNQGRALLVPYVNIGGKKAATFSSVYVHNSIISFIFVDKQRIVNISNMKVLKTALLFLMCVSFSFSCKEG